MSIEEMVEKTDIQFVINHGMDVCARVSLKKTLNKSEEEI